MSKKDKKLAKVEKARKAREQKELAAKREYEKSINKTVFGKPVTIKRGDVVPRIESKGLYRETKQYKSADITMGPDFVRKPKKLSEDMKQREAEAQKEIIAKSKRVAPAYSKGAYQYISDLDIEYLGKKV